jgi:membrane fusion protein, heavy metal efflux system
MKKNIFIPLLVLAFLSSCGKNLGTKTAEILPEDIVELREDQAKLAGVDTGHVEMRMISNSLQVSGTVNGTPQNIASVCFPMGGFIKSTTLIPGNRVHKGQVLAIIENQEFLDIQQQYLEAHSRLEFAEAEFHRHSELYKNDVYSQQNVQEVTADYKSLKAQVNALGQKLGMIGINADALREDGISSTVPIKSPINGYIRTVNINLGKYVAPSDILFEIVNCDELLLELTLFEKDADKAGPGQNIRFFINNETEEHHAVVYQTGKSIGADKTCKVYARVSGICKNLLPGMYVNAYISTGGNRVLSLPSESIVNFDDKDYIFVFEKNKTEEDKNFTEYKMVEVRKGFTENGYTEVILPAGFSMKAAIVTRGAYNLLSAKMNAGEMAC